MRCFRFFFLNFAAFHYSFPAFSSDSWYSANATRLETENRGTMPINLFSKPSNRPDQPRMRTGVKRPGPAVDNNSHLTHSSPQISVTIRLFPCAPSRRAQRMYLYIFVWFEICKEISSPLKPAIRYTRVGTLIVATIYLQLIQNRYTTCFEVLMSFNVVTSIVYNPLPAMWKS